MFRKEKKIKRRKKKTKILNLERRGPPSRLGVSI